MIWVPEPTPPLLNTDAAQQVLGHIHSEGLSRTVSRGFALIEDDNEPVSQYLYELGQELNGYTDGENWPARALKMGASLTMLAYREAGYFNSIDSDAIAVGSLFAQLGGIPDTYLVAATSDIELMSLSAKIARMEKLDGDNEGGHTQVYEIGAGCIRHYLQQALMAA